MALPLLTAQGSSLCLWLSGFPGHSWWIPLPLLLTHALRSKADLLISLHSFFFQLKQRLLGGRLTGREYEVEEEEERVPRGLG